MRKYLVPTIDILESKHKVVINDKYPDLYAVIPWDRVLTIKDLDNFLNEYVLEHPEYNVDLEFVEQEDLDEPELPELESYPDPVFIDDANGYWHYDTPPLCPNERPCIEKDLTEYETRELPDNAQEITAMLELLSEKPCVMDSDHKSYFEPSDAVNKAIVSIDKTDRDTVDISDEEHETDLDDPDIYYKYINGEDNYVAFYYCTIDYWENIEEVNQLCDKGDLYEKFYSVGFKDTKVINELLINTNIKYLTLRACDFLHFDTLKLNNLKVLYIDSTIYRFIEDIEDMSGIESLVAVYDPYYKDQFEKLIHKVDSSTIIRVINESIDTNKEIHSIIDGGESYVLKDYPQASLFYEGLKLYDNFYKHTFKNNSYEITDFSYGYLTDILTGGQALSVPTLQKLILYIDLYRETSDEEKYYDELSSMTELTNDSYISYVPHADWVVTATRLATNQLLPMEPEQHKGNEDVLKIVPDLLHWTGLFPYSDNDNTYNDLLLEARKQITKFYTPAAKMYISNYIDLGFPLDELLDSYKEAYIDIEEQDEPEFDFPYDKTERGWKYLYYKLNAYIDNGLVIYQELTIKQTQETLYNLFPTELVSYKTIESEDSMDVFYSKDNRMPYVSRNTCYIDETREQFFTSLFDPLIITNGYLNVESMYRYRAASYILSGLVRHRVYEERGYPTSSAFVLTDTNPGWDGVVHTDTLENFNLRDYYKCNNDLTCDERVKNYSTLCCNDKDEVVRCEHNCEELVEKYPTLCCDVDGNVIRCKDKKERCAELAAKYEHICCSEEGDPIICPRDYPEIKCSDLAEKYNFLCCNGENLVDITSILYEAIIDPSLLETIADKMYHDLVEGPLKELVDNKYFGIEYVKTFTPTSQILYLLLYNLTSGGHSTLTSGSLDNIRKVPFNGSINILGPIDPRDSKFITFDGRLSKIVEEVENYDMDPVAQDFTGSYIEYKTQNLDCGGKSMDPLVQDISNMLGDKAKLRVLNRLLNEYARPSIDVRTTPWTAPGGGGDPEELKKHMAYTSGDKPITLSPYNTAFMFMSNHITNSEEQSYDFIPNYYNLMRHERLVIYVDITTDFNMLCDLSNWNREGECKQVPASILILSKRDILYIIQQLSIRPFRTDRFKHIHLYDQEEGVLYELQHSDMIYKMLTECERRSYCYYSLPYGGTIDV